MRANILLLTIVLFIANSLMACCFETEVMLIKLLETHVFLFFIFFIEETIYLKLTKKKNMRPIYFLSINFFKIIASIVFLSPLIFSKNKTDENQIFFFFGAYFVLLFYTAFKKFKY